MRAIKVTAFASYRNGNTEVIEFASKAECRRLCRQWGLRIEWVCSSRCNVYDC